jgi:hypothetical protein
VGLFAAGNLRGSKSGGAGDGGVDECELLSAKAGGWKIHGVFDAECVNGFEGGYKAADFLFHNYLSVLVSPRTTSGGLLRLSAG